MFKKFQEAPLEGFKLDFAELEESFALKKISSKMADAKAKQAAKEDQTVNVLDGKISQNLSIWLSQYKGKSHTQIVRALLQLDSSMFTAASIKTLMSTLPGKEGERAVQGYLVTYSFFLSFFLSFVLFILMIHLIHLCFVLLV